MSGVTKFRPMRVRRSSKLRGSGGTHILSFAKLHKKKSHGATWVPRKRHFVVCSGPANPKIRNHNFEEFMYLKLPVWRRTILLKDEIIPVFL
ncbi:hypothetical protein AVEN_130968-1 [Araneus ventricosus]|uniref:Uncharacterized protein n=1 Tax=Araneus ventricosus TaxID=182803 RepID=A0A4Y2LSL5_ARAVE|nr:hypothetical protein AVEN_130968-1 [Araneus ventricosus]